MSGEKYEANSMDAAVSRIETKLDSALNALTEQNRRLTVLEIAENKRTGALVAIGTVCTMVGGGIIMLVDLLKGK